MNYSVIEISSPQLLRKFLDLPYLIYRNDKNYVYPLRTEVREKINPSKNPFFKYGSVNLFGVVNEQKTLVGRIAAITNPKYEENHGIRTGFFGMLETVNDKRVIALLIDKIKSFLKETGCNKIIGPVNFTTNDECGVLIEGFDHSASFLCAFNEKYYSELLEYCNLSKAVDMMAYIGKVDHIYPEKFSRIITRIQRNSDITLRTFEKKRKEEDTRIICELYNECFRNVWGYVPLTLDEANEMSKKFLTFYDPELIWIAFVKGVPAAFILGLPDINQILKKIRGKLFPISIIKLYLNKNKIDSLRVLAMGVIPDYRNIGLECILINKIHQRMKNTNYKTGELSFIMENNFRMRRVLENLGFKIYKRYRIYETNI